MKFYINTLGEFDIKADGQSILKDTTRTYKIYKLFEYFLTFRNKKLLPETIIDSLLSDSESDDPKNMLRTQIFRLRKIINAFIPKDEDATKFLNLNFTNGYYSLEIGENIVIDIDEFENFIRLGDRESDYNIDCAMKYYEKAIALYKGLYLYDNAYEVWLVPTRNYYQRLYTKILYKYIELLKKNENHEMIVPLCEKALLIEPYEENIHIEMMEALLKSGHSKSAMNHYEYAINMLEKEMDAKPSQRFTDFPKKIQDHAHRKNDIDIEAIKKNLDEEQSSGAMYCSLDYFQFLFNIQKRRSLRNNQNDYLCVLTINRNDFDKINRNRGLKDIFSVLEKILRKGDVYTYWNENQILIMCHDVKGNGIDVIEERLINEIRRHTKIEKNEISVTCQPVLTQKIIL